MIQSSGQVDSAFKQVREVFEHNFDSDSAWPEVGAGYCVYVGGQQVVELTGGVADQESGREWSTDTIANVFSSTKIMPALAIAQLVEAGQVSYDDPIAKYWPEFEANGKGGITLAHVLSHQSGVNAFEDPVAFEDLGDWDKRCTQLAGQTPFCAPGEKSAYHAFTYGHLTMEVVRRLTGMLPSQYVAERISGPLGADFQIGAKEADWSRIATLVPPPPPPADRPMPDPQAAKAIMNPMVAPPMTATPVWRRAEIPAANGHASARGIARLWGGIANDGSLEGKNLVARSTIDAMRKPLNNGPDMMLGPAVIGAGVLINPNNVFGPNPAAFGNVGFGGSGGFADLDLKLACGYVPNRLFPDLLQDPRARALHTAAVECAGKAGA